MPHPTGAHPIGPNPIVPSQAGPADPGLLSASTEDAEFLTLAIEMALRSVDSGGGPFGAVVVHRGLVLGIGTNEVSKTYDPTAHAEVVALRAACRRLARTELDDCVLYANCEPCPLCLSACRWVRLPRVVHASSRASALASAYADELHYESLEPVTTRTLLVQQAWIPTAGEPFAAWREVCRAPDLA